MFTNQQVLSRQSFIAALNFAVQVSDTTMPSRNKMTTTKTSHFSLLHFSFCILLPLIIS